MAVTHVTGLVGGDERLRLVVAEDNLLVREGLVHVLTRRSRIELCETCETLSGLLAAVDEHRPHVVLTDIRMPPDHDREGIEAARRLRVSHPDVGVVVISAHLDPTYVLSLFEDGTHRRGYVVKDRLADADRLVHVLETVAAGGSFLDDDVVDALVHHRLSADRVHLPALTIREHDVLAELASGRTNAAIASSLCVSRHAIEKHCNSIFAKLGLTEDSDMNRRVAAVLLYLTDRSVAA